MTIHPESPAAIEKAIINIDDNSLYQPEWHTDNGIFIVSEHDKNNPFWNLYLYNITMPHFILTIKTTSYTCFIILI